MLDNMAGNGDGKNIVFTSNEHEFVMRYLVGNNARIRNEILVPQVSGFARVVPLEELRIQTAAESCAFRSVMSFFVGGALGAFIGLFLSSITPHQTVTPMTTRETLMDMKKTIFSNAKNFAIIGAMFTGTECVVESYRAKSDTMNSVHARFITGGVLGLRAGPMAAFYGGCGFAAFSVAIDYFMHESELFNPK